ncbi:MBL fold metallo-hydrolase [Jeotgalibacillus proteolyticus]|uniref:MBL fold metallo-hydrolase n=1 Tax=Jeotgalibacillus proteolyticus TaxID=2082395 RepID=A0A2S5GDT1_9BACL|nr:MBL fold metallo-hydrolase [Jeotgalibacillus proteolyticus]PPA71156.1 MBL fold metallo-hydrolase [Jeotgalibacillus proteolyticus]
MKDKLIPVLSIKAGSEKDVASDVFMYTNQVVNLFFVTTDKTANSWVLVDAGMPKSAEKIKEEAEEHYGEGAKPQAIILTHGHFDHVGAVEELAREWDVPVYAHTLEKPYLTGEQDYPEPDPKVDEGLVAKMAPKMFPNEGINLGTQLQLLPEDGKVPFLDEWKWVHTPGHTPGHVSLFRERDRFLIAGDAFVTVKQESLAKVAMQTLEISGPPKYLTMDFQASWDSVRKLRDLEPSVAVTGHGRPMEGGTLSESLEKLVNNFEEIAMPD